MPSREKSQRERDAYFPDMVGFGANRRGGRLPSLFFIFMMVVIAILSFNYWTVSNRQSSLLDELVEAQTQVKRTDAARSRLEKRNSELIVQVDTHRKQIDQKEGDYSLLEGKLQAQQADFRKCSDEKMKLQNDVASKSTEIQRLTEQIKELNQELMRHEEQLREVKKNNTILEKKLEHESLQCGRQVAQLKEENDEARRAMQTLLSKLKQELGSHQKNAVPSAGAEGALVAKMVAERHTVASRRLGVPDLKEEMGKPGSDAGMPGIEDSEVGKIDEAQFALKKPVITQKRDEAPDVMVGGGAGPGVGAADGPGAQGLSLDLPGLQQDRVEGRAAMIAPPGIVKPAEKVVVFEEDNKAGLRADELGEQQRQLRAPEIKNNGEHLKAPNPAQVPKPILPRPKDHAAAEAAHHRQNDDDRDIQADRAVDYGKRHQAIDIL